MTNRPERARYIMIGGFLGAGKTTSVLQLAEHLHAKGLRVGLISNDQASGLVDTQRMRAAGHAVAEIAGGCFCCRFDSLKDAAADLTRAEQPDVFIAEPVGSCTDLIATVSYPLRRMYGDEYEIAPLSVVLDPRRASGMLGLTDATFSEKVRYIYLRQIEEASLLVINKTDLISAAETDSLEDALKQVNPRATILRASAENGDGLENWFDAIMNGQQPIEHDLNIDYEMYADGEARLGWCNLTAELMIPLNNVDLALKQLADQLRSDLNEQSISIAHLKMTFLPSDDPESLAAVSIVDNKEQPALTHSLEGGSSDGLLTVNLRAEAEPHQLETCCSQHLLGQWLIRDLESFAPAAPVPVHRDTAESVT